MIIQTGFRSVKSTVWLSNLPPIRFWIRQSSVYIALRVTLNTPSVIPFRTIPQNPPAHFCRSNLGVFCKLIVHAAHLEQVQEISYSYLHYYYSLISAAPFSAETRGSPVETIAFVLSMFITNT